MIYRETETGALLGNREMRAKYPHINPGPGGYPAEIAQVVRDTGRPVAGLHEKVVEAGVLADGDGWAMAWAVESLDSPEYLVDHRRDKIIELAAIRFECETGGIDFGGNLVATDRETQSQLSGALLGMGRKADREIAWKANGVYTKLTKPAIEAMHDAVFDHVQACRAHEETLALALGAATTLAEIDAVDITVGWPT